LLDLVATLSAPGGCGAVVTGSLHVAANVDAAASTVDSVETSTSAWTASDETWSRVEVAPGEHAWLGANNPFHSDASLVSPPLQVGAGELTLSFEHRHDFEASNGTYWDGGLIEVSSDGGVTWQDLSAYGSVSYGGTIGDAANEAKNPLNGRAGYVAKNPSWPARDAVTIGLGAAFADQTIRLRFRVGSDAAEGATGWEVDTIALTGITNQPFLTLADDAASCGASPGAGGAGDARGEGAAARSRSPERSRAWKITAEGSRRCSSVGKLAQERAEQGSSLRGAARLRLLPRPHRRDPHLDLVGAARDRSGEVLVAIGRHDHVVLDAHADAAVLGRHGEVVHLEVEPGLDREHHPGAQLAVRVGLFARLRAVVDVEAEHVADVVERIALIELLLLRERLGRRHGEDA
jgi:hypothetical protein